MTGGPGTHWQVMQMLTHWQYVQGLLLLRLLRLLLLVVPLTRSLRRQLVRVMAVPGRAAGSFSGFAIASGTNSAFCKCCASDIPGRRVAAVK